MKKITMNESARSRSLLVAVAGSLVMGISAHAQPEQVPPPPPGGLKTAPPPPPLQSVATYQATIVKMAVNDDYVYDGFYILNNADSILVKFPPHLGTQITTIGKVGTTVSVNGVLRTAPEGEKEIRLVNITAGGKTVTDTGNATPPNPPAETYTSGAGKVTKLQTTRRGDVNGVILDSKTILRVPPHIARQLTSIVTNASIAYTGMKKAAHNGEVMAADYSIVRCKTITVNGQQYVTE